MICETLLDKTGRIPQGAVTKKPADQIEQVVDWHTATRIVEDHVGSGVAH
ncbi:MAG: hypothetical protein P8X96_24680 [Desulfobacteraceae bacterium]